MGESKQYNKLKRANGVSRLLMMSFMHGEECAGFLQQWLHSELWRQVVWNRQLHSADLIWCFHTDQRSELTDKVTLTHKKERKKERKVAIILCIWKVGENAFKLCKNWNHGNLESNIGILKVSRWVRGVFTGGITLGLKGLLTRGRERGGNEYRDAQANHIVGSCASVAEGSQSVAREY